MLKCPHCHYHRFWRLRRQHARCKKCKREWSLKNWIVPFSRITEQEWIIIIASFIRDRTLTAVTQETIFSVKKIHSALTVLRRVMSSDIPERFAGPTEIDDAFLGPRWHNRRRWQHTTRRGRGTDQQPVLGLFDRKTGKALAYAIPKVQWKYIRPFVIKQIKKHSTIYTDTYTAYQKLEQASCTHEAVDHVKGEYVRGNAHTNNIESFWGYVKRQFKVTGGIRRSRLPLYLGEWSWRWNHRKQTREEKIKQLLKLLKEHNFSGR